MTSMAKEDIIYSSVTCRWFMFFSLLAARLFKPKAIETLRVCVIEYLSEPRDQPDEEALTMS
ncbi:hypothetical protein M378DRAFT_173686, partial [Amanita muscaria Koide BX008]